MMSEQMPEIYQELFSDYREVPSVPRKGDLADLLGLDEETAGYWREFCQHKHTRKPRPAEVGKEEAEPKFDIECSHRHVRIRTPNVPKDDGEGDEEGDVPPERKRNREAVRKYRQRKKEQKESLDQEMTRLREENRALREQFKGMGALVAELKILREMAQCVRQAVGNTAEALVDAKAFAQNHAIQLTDCNTLSRGHTGVRSHSHAQVHVDEQGGCDHGGCSHDNTRHVQGSACEGGACHYKEAMEGALKKPKVGESELLWMTQSEAPRGRTRGVQLQGRGSSAEGSLQFDLLFNNKQDASRDPSVHNCCDLSTMDKPLPCTIFSMDSDLESDHLHPDTKLHMHRPNGANNSCGAQCLETQLDECTNIMQLGEFEPHREITTAHTGNANACRPTST
mmetsp:Transcript_14352/g.24297  ORF Transcript_14352/g.24297 Transcript_14352/m.24297 type:complete len:396 (+) Transcript_14352:254-1441(+)